MHFSNLYLQSQLYLIPQFKHISPNMISSYLPSSQPACDLVNRRADGKVSWFNIKFKISGEMCVLDDKPIFPVSKVFTFIVGTIRWAMR